MVFEKFEDILSWQKGIDLTVDIYNIFKSHRDFGFKDQIQRAVLSIPNNIAEGYERKSNKEFKQFLFIAKGSAGEVRSMLYVANRLKYITDDLFNSLYKRCIEISKLTSGLIQKL
jgi:four helix bundle protein